MKAALLGPRRPLALLIQHAGSITAPDALRRLFQRWRVLADDLLGEAVVDCRFKRGALSDETSGDEPRLQPVVAGAQQDRVAAPDPERVIAGNRGAQQSWRHARKERLHRIGEGLR